MNSFLQSAHVLPDAVHEAGAKVGVQLWHGNRIPSGLGTSDTRGEPIAPSPRTESDPPLLFLRPSEKMRELKGEEIEKIISKFAEAAASAKKVGFDFVELHGAHGYLLCQFFSPIHNRRKDGYGGDLSGRMRFGLECFAAMRKKVGEDYPLFFRIGAEGDGIKLSDSIQFASDLKEAGVDVLDVSTADHVSYCIPGSGQPMGTFVHYAEAIKSEVHIPVIAVGRINKPEVAEDILVREKADFSSYRASVDRGPILAGESGGG